ncbi:mitochondrial P-loop-containing NTPase superfamily member [Andalucia godoyi]|uniref:Mitochondrial P-loop-containing NTPase superfamily member n=1 Tax=Andalucia godoyi TaxID=505711 RepID=A0A8K0F0Y1_ANDGO|nr:mitochondrial P-loop-containing NTPase superfamily member [Andalucia godoyi]|eukprot:ANDGO_00638.mRNA.1 mitochondrial P-loop-containing NTPase superfamily member
MIRTSRVLLNRGGYESTLTSIAVNPAKFSQQKQASELRFVFLEGCAAVGKSTVCSRLSKMGFSTRLENFVSLCSKYPQYDPAGSCMSLKWTSGLLKSIEQYQEQFARDPSSIRHGLVFFDRSFLTPYVYRRDASSNDRNAHLLDMMKEVTKIIPSKIVYCHTELDIIKLRLSQRYMVAAVDEERSIRQKLGEVDDAFIVQTLARYEELEQCSWFSIRLNTTDTRQATSMLLDNLGIQFTLPFLSMTQPAADATPSNLQQTGS